MNRFFIGLYEPAHAWPFQHVMISANRLRRRKSGFIVNNWMIDSGAFSELSLHGAYRHDTNEYVQLIKHWSQYGSLSAAVSQDYMCEEMVLARTGLSIRQHQELTIERYLAIREGLGEELGTPYLMPVLQGYSAQDYLDHLEMYGDLLYPSQWVGVGSVCKRNGNPDAIEDVLLPIKDKRPDLRLHGFGIKFTALERPTVRQLLYSADSMAWSFAGMYEKYRGKKDENDPRRALEYAADVEQLIGKPSFIQDQLFKWWTT